MREFETKERGYYEKMLRISLSLFLIFYIYLEIKTQESNCDNSVKYGSNLVACNAVDGISVLADDGAFDFDSTIACNIDKTYLYEDMAKIYRSDEYVLRITNVVWNPLKEKFEVSETLDIENNHPQSDC